MCGVDEVYGVDGVCGVDVDMGSIWLMNPCRILTLVLSGTGVKGRTLSEGPGSGSLGSLFRRRLLSGRVFFFFAFTLVTQPVKI